MFFQLDYHIKVLIKIFLLNLWIGYRLLVGCYFDENAYLISNNIQKISAHNILSPGSCGEGVFTKLADMTEALDGQPHPVDRPLVLPRLRLGPEHPGAVRQPAPELPNSVITAHVRLQTLLAINLQILMFKTYISEDTLCTLSGSSGQ